jgi:hypothetical protein
MSYGVKIWGPNRELWMDSSLVTWNMVEAFRVEANQFAYRSYPDLSGYTFYAIQIPLEVPKVESQTYEKTLDVFQNSILVYGGNQAALVLVVCK